MATGLIAELEKLANAMETGASSADAVALPSLAEKIAKELRVKVDEVAILAVSNRWRHLHFLAPAALKNVGFVPLTSNSALAARTARESRPEINNNFSAVRHATVFEGVKAATTTGESIQKIVSAPILNEGKVVGVIQSAARVRAQRSRERISRQMIWGRCWRFAGLWGSWLGIWRENEEGFGFSVSLGQ